MLANIPSSIVVLNYQESIVSGRKSTTNFGTVVNIKRMVRNKEQDELWRRYRLQFAFCLPDGRVSSLHAVFEDAVAARKEWFDCNFTQKGRPGMYVLGR